MNVVPVCVPHALGRTLCCSLPLRIQHSCLVLNHFAINFAHVLPQFLLPAHSHPHASLLSSPWAVIPGVLLLGAVGGCLTSGTLDLAVWLCGCVGNIKLHSCVETSTAICRVMQGLVSALWWGCRAYLSDQLLLWVTSVWAVKKPVQTHTHERAGGAQ